MERCDELAGRFRVEFRFVQNDGSEDPAERIVRIGDHGSVWLCDDGARRERVDPPIAEFAGDNRTWAEIEACPHVSQSQPYVGELCAHEVRWLAAAPGKTFNPHWRFSVTPAKED